VDLLTPEQISNENLVQNSFFEEEKIFPKKIQGSEVLISPKSELTQKLNTFMSPSQSLSIPKSEEVPLDRPPNYNKTFNSMVTMKANSVTFSSISNHKKTSQPEQILNIKSSPENELTSQLLQEDVSFTSEASEDCSETSVWNDFDYETHIKSMSKKTIMQS
jgi:hypothetical protein